VFGDREAAFLVQRVDRPPGLLPMFVSDAACESPWCFGLDEWKAD
jgi:hypothetical protein